MAGEPVDVAAQVDSMWESVKEHIEDEQEAFRVGFMSAFKYLLGGQETLLKRLEDEFEIELREIQLN